MFLFRSRENAQRKYIDLIKRAAAKCPNWDPPRNIRVSTASPPQPLVSFSALSACLPQPGDFGTVNKKTGELIVEGNIYTHPDIAQIACQHRPIRAAEVDHYHINSFEVRQLGVNVDARA
jgi:hypothetical protein